MMSSSFQMRMVVMKGESPLSSSKPGQSGSTAWALNLCATKPVQNEANSAHTKTFTEGVRCMFSCGLTFFFLSFFTSFPILFERSLKRDSFKCILVDLTELVPGFFKVFTRSKVNPLPTVDK